MSKQKLTNGRMIKEARIDRGLVQNDMIQFL